MPTVLIVEDDVKLATLFAQAFKAANFETTIAHDGHQAMEQLAGTPPEIVVLDLHLPKIMGQDILLKIRASAHLSDVYVILTTADAVMADAIRSDADLVLIKPVSYNQLRDIAGRLYVQPPL